MNKDIMTGSSDPELRISGYASLFDQTDMGNDVVRRGAFSASLLRQSGKALPMLLGHETQNPVGVWDRVFEDKSGLFVSGLIIAGDVRAARTLMLIQKGALSGLSIGYRTVRARKTDIGRELLELDLWEVSVVAFPMLRTARITQISGPSNETSPSRETFKRRYL